ncbi:hypothetical protein AAFF_G00058820 [Aldrovandia affinis]|uniref:Uncharacterized protein n=1 Tax=Aldrovandia affinis TaxID=143900 RepID=A0AAD7S0I6_9TELE|nr:hypothetical protein AAFF_G00058820 [Aldrovandia affinis]
MMQLKAIRFDYGDPTPLLQREAREISSQVESGKSLHSLLWTGSGRSISGDGQPRKNINGKVSGGPLLASNRRHVIGRCQETEAVDGPAALMRNAHFQSLQRR